VQEEEKSGSRNVIAAIVALILAIGGGGVFAWLATRNPSTPPDPVANNSEPNPNQTGNPGQTPSNTPDGTSGGSPSNLPPDISATERGELAPSANGKFKIYYLDENLKVTPEEGKTPSKDPERQDISVRRALTRLLASAGNPKQEGKKSSAIPPTTKLLGTTVKPSGIFINLSKEFAEGGGSTSMQARLAQILYTATERNTKGKVWISVEGKKLETLGGEGIEVKQPLTRKTFQQDFKGSVDEQ
jgi:spore germination protein GerM